MFSSFSVLSVTDTGTSGRFHSGLLSSPKELLQHVVWGARAKVRVAAKDRRVAAPVPTTGSPSIHTPHAARWWGKLAFLYSSDPPRLCHLRERKLCDRRTKQYQRPAAKHTGPQNHKRQQISSSRVAIGFPHISNLTRHIEAETSHLTLTYKHLYLRQIFNNRRIIS